MGFGIADYAVFVSVLVISAAVGLYYRLTGGRQRTTSEYLLADQNMNVVPVAFSLMASFMSAVTLLGVPAENYIYGTQFVLINVSYIFGTFIAAFLYLPVFFNLQATSVYEYLELRFGKATRIVASISFIAQMILYMSIVLYAPALALNAVTGFSKWASILSVGFVCTFYSTIGGMKAVLWTDLIQSVLMFAAIFAVIIRGLYDQGFSTVWKIAEEGGRIEFFNWSPDPTVRHTFWTQMLGGIFTYTSLYGVNQAQVQRLLTVKSLPKSQLALFLNWPVLTLLSLTSCFSGLVVYSKYYDCDPIKSKRISSIDQLLPLFVMDYLNHLPGAAGLFVSGILSGALSTVSSAVNSLAAVVVEDFIRPCCPSKRKNDRIFALFSKGLALGFGVICIALTYLVEQLGGILQASLTIFGIVGGPLLGLFSLGMFCYRCNQTSALVGYACSIVLSFYIGFGAFITKPVVTKLPQSIEGCISNETQLLVTTNMSYVTPVFTSTYFIINTTSNSNLTEEPINDYDKNQDIPYPFRISYMWYAPIGFLTVIIVGNITSFITGAPEYLNPDLLSPPFAYCYKRRLKSKQFTSLPTVADNGLVTTKESSTTILDDGEESSITKL